MFIATILLATLVAVWLLPLGGLLIGAFRWLLPVAVLAVVLPDFAVEATVIAGAVVAVIGLTRLQHKVDRWSHR